MYKVLPGSTRAMRHFLSLARSSSRSGERPQRANDSHLSNSGTAVSAAPPEVAQAHFESEFMFETDCWDVHDAFASGSPGFVLLDVRSPALFAAGHVPGAISLPHDKIIGSRMREWPEGTLFVTYCAGPRLQRRSPRRAEARPARCPGKDNGRRNNGMAGRGFPVGKGRRQIGRSLRGNADFFTPLRGLLHQPALPPERLSRWLPTNDCRPRPHVGKRTLRPHACEAWWPLPLKVESGQSTGPIYPLH